MTGMKSSAASFHTGEFPKLVIIPLRDVFLATQYSIGLLAPFHAFNFHDFVYYVMKYIFDESDKITPRLDQTECRTMLKNIGLTEEQMLWVEHQAIAMAISLVGETHSFIKMLSYHDQIIGFNWDINNAKDLVITILYR